MEEKQLLGKVFNIQRFSIHDGPGIRTTVFMKGCNLRCFWCHNPESISPKTQIRYYSDKCICCMACAECPNTAHIFKADANGFIHLFDRTKCEGCGICIEKCYSEALVLDGKYYDADSLFAEIKKDISFYGEDGGATFSGGEPLLQADFIAEVAKKCKEAGISVTLDTAANLPFSEFEKVLPYTDYVLFDVKHWDSETHKRATGVGNERIKENLAKLLVSDIKVRIRVPLIPGVNASEEDARRIALYVKDCIDESGGKIDRFEFMPFHGTALGKYQSLGLDYAAKSLEAPSKEEVEGYYGIVREYINW